MNNMAQHYDELLLERARMDKFFSIFLDENDLDEEEFTSPAWNIYKKKLEEYSYLDLKIRSVELKLQGNLK